MPLVLSGMVSMIATTLSWRLMALLGRVVRRRVAAVVRRRGLRAVFEQRRDDRLVAVGAGHVQRRVAAVAARHDVGALGQLLEHLLELAVAREEPLRSRLQRPLPLGVCVQHRNQ